MIRGTLNRLHLGDLLQWLQMGGLSGRLTLKDDGWERHLDFLAGRVVYASSQMPEERLASTLAEDGILPAVDLRRLLAESLLRRTLFTDHLFEKGGVHPDAVRSSLTKVAQRITARVIMAPQVDFVLDPAYPVRDLLGLNLDVEPTTLVMEAARLRDEALRGASTDEGLPFSGEAFDSFFWTLIEEGVSGGESLDGAQMVATHELVRKIMTTLAQWLASSPGLVPLPAGQVQEIKQAAQGPVALGAANLPHAAWNQMVLACSVRSADLRHPAMMSELEATAHELQLWQEIAATVSWHRPHAGRLDELTRTVAAVWTRAARSAAPIVGVDPDQATLAAQLVVVPTDLVLWVLTTLPVPHQRLRLTLLRRLPERLGAALAQLADFPEGFRVILDGRRASSLGACLHVARDLLPSATLWPRAVPDEREALLEVASPSVLAQATKAARRALEEPQSEPIRVG